MKRVIAIQSFDKETGLLKSFGEGELLGALHLPDNIMSGISNPCIKLDSGKYVWGYQCWWGDIEDFHAQYDEHIKTTEIVQPDEDTPSPSIREGAIILINEKCSNKGFQNCLAVVDESKSFGCIASVRCPKNRDEAYYDAPIRLQFEEFQYISMLK